MKPMVSLLAHLTLPCSHGYRAKCRACASLVPRPSFPRVDHAARKCTSRLKGRPQCGCLQSQWIVAHTLGLSTLLASLPLAPVVCVNLTSPLNSTLCYLTLKSKYNFLLEIYSAFPTTTQSKGDSSLGLLVEAKGRSVFSGLPACSTE